jgi:hypothetical protein
MITLTRMRKNLSTFAHAHNPNSLRMRTAVILPYGNVHSS